MILSGIQAMLPALGHEWYSQNEQNLKEDSEKNMFTVSNDGWGHYTIDSALTVGQMPSMAIDSEGYIHVAYYSVTLKDLKYATDSTGEWVTQTIDSNGFVNRYRLSSKLDELRKEKEYYVQEIDKVTIDKEKFESNEEILEKYAREEYLMKKESEDIFYVIKE